jgi:hypothetical protein
MGGVGSQGPLHARPKRWGKLVVEMIYDTQDADIAEYLRNNKPPPGVVGIDN